MGSKCYICLELRRQLDQSNNKWPDTQSKRVATLLEPFTYLGKSMRIMPESVLEIPCYKGQDLWDNKIGELESESQKCSF